MNCVRISYAQCFLPLLTRCLCLVGHSVAIYHFHQAPNVPQHKRPSMLVRLQCHVDSGNTTSSRGVSCRRDAGEGNCRPLQVKMEAWKGLCIARQVVTQWEKMSGFDIVRLYVTLTRRYTAFVNPKLVIIELGPYFTPWLAAHPHVPIN